MRLRFPGQLRIAEVEADTEPRRVLEQHLRLGTRHLALEEGVDLGLIFHVPAREEGRKRKLGKDDETAAALLGPDHQGAEPAHRACAAFIAGDRPHLRRADGEGASHGAASFGGDWAASFGGDWTVCASLLRQSH
jgi:hypothetical protein